MIIVLKPSCTLEQQTKFSNMLKDKYDVKVNVWEGVHSTVLGLLGDTMQIDIEYIEAQEFVERVKRVQEPYKKANRKFHPENTGVAPTSLPRPGAVRRYAARSTHSFLPTI